MDAKHLAGFEERRGEWRGIGLRWYVGGHAGAPPTVLIHGLGGAATNWTLVAPALARTRRVIVPDLPGHGGSAPLPAAPTLAPFADAVAAVLAQEEVTGTPVVGHSMGGAVGLRLAVRRPELVSGLVLFSGAGISSGAEIARRTLWIVATIKPAKRIARFDRQVARSRLLRTLSYGFWFASDPAAFAPEAAEAFLAGSREYTDVGTAWRALVADELRPELERCNCPALVVWGAEDRQLPLDDGFEYARRLRAPIRVVPDAGHLVIGERPEACVDAVLDFLERASL